jgi:hypothetical protein
MRGIFLRRGRALQRPRRQRQPGPPAPAGAAEGRLGPGEQGEPVITVMLPDED